MTRQLPLIPDATVECYGCKKQVEQENLLTGETPSGAKIFLCEYCQSDFFSCFYCSNLEDKQDGKYLDDLEEHVCENCFISRRCFTCEDCEDNYSESTYHYMSVGDEIICDHCISDYNACSSCSYYVHETDSLYCDRCDEYRCQSCDEEHYHDEGEFSEREYTNVPVGTHVGKLITHSRLVGVEIEVEGINDISEYINDEVPDYVGVYEDGSLNSGVEIVTPPASLDRLEKVITDTCSSINSMSELRATASCGLHIHMDASDFRGDKRKLKQILLTYLQVEPLLYYMLPRSRSHTHYSAPLNGRYEKNRFKYAKDFDYELYKTRNTAEVESRKRNKYDDIRYCGVNLHSIFYRGTVEIRYHSGTTNSNKILQWIAINQGILDYAIRRYNKRKLESDFAADVPIMDRINHMADTFRLKQETKEYITKRMMQFNPILFETQEEREERIKKEIEEREKRQKAYEEQMDRFRRESIARQERYGDNTIRWEESTYTEDASRYLNTEPNANWSEVVSSEPVRMSDYLNALRGSSVSELEESEE